MNIAYTTEDIVSHGIGYQLTAGRAGTSVTSLLGLLVATLAEVISASVDDQSALFNVRDDHNVDRYTTGGRTYAKNALSTNQLHKLVLLGANGVTLGISLEVTQVTDVTLLILGATVGLAEGVD